MSDAETYSLEVRTIQKGVHTSTYSFTIINSEDQVVEIRQGTYTRRDLEIVVNKLQLRFSQLTTFYLTPDEKIDHIYTLLDFALESFVGWYRAYASQLTLDQHTKIQTRLQKLLSMVERTSPPIQPKLAEEGRPAHAEVVLLKKGLFKNNYLIRLIDTNGHIVDTFGGVYSSASLKRALRSIHPNYSNYATIPHSQHLDGVQWMMVLLLNSFRSNYNEYHMRLSPEQRAHFHEHLHHILRVITEQGR